MKNITPFKFTSIISLILLCFIVLVRIPTSIEYFWIGKDHELADAINGLTAPVIGLVTAYLLYSALKAQTDANNLNQAQNQILVIGQMIEHVQNMITNFSYQTKENNLASPERFSGFDAMKHFTFEVLSKDDGHSLRHYTPTQKIVNIINKIQQTEDYLNTSKIDTNTKSHFQFQIDLIKVEMTERSHALLLSSAARHTNADEYVYKVIHKFFQSNHMQFGYDKIVMPNQM